MLRNILAGAALCLFALTSIPAAPALASSGPNLYKCNTTGKPVVDRACGVFGHEVQPGRCAALSAARQEFAAACRGEALSCYRMEGNERRYGHVVVHFNERSWSARCVH